MVKQERAGAVVGVAGTVVSCSAMMFSLFPALLGVVGASASTGMMGMAATPVMPGWVVTVTHYSWAILAVSILLMIWAMRRTSRTAQVILGVGIILLIVNELSMTPYLFLPALALILLANIVGWRSAQRLSGA